MRMTDHYAERNARGRIEADAHGARALAGELSQDGPQVLDQIHDRRARHARAQLEIRLGQAAVFPTASDVDGPECLLSQHPKELGLALREGRNGGHGPTIAQDASDGPAEEEPDAKSLNKSLC